MNAIANRWPILRKNFPWIFVSLFFLFVFTLAKFPDAKIKSLIQSQINDSLAPAGISLHAEESSLSLFFGVRYTLNQVSVLAAGSPNPIKLDRVRVSPSLLSLLFGKMGGTAYLRQGAGEISIDFSTAKNRLSMQLDVDSVDLKKLDIFKLLYGVSISGILNGSIDISGDPNTLNTLDGKINLNIKDLQIEEQTAQIQSPDLPMPMSVKLPLINAGNAEIDLTLKKGEVEFNSINLKNGADLISLSGTGKATLGRTALASKLNLDLIYKISDKIEKLPLVSVFIGSYRRADGSYGMRFNGEIAQLQNEMPQPIP